MPLGTDIGRGTVDIALDADPAPLPRKRHSSTQMFGPCLLWPDDWMHKDTTWYGGIGLGPGDIVLDGDPAPHGKGHSRPHPHFSAHFAMAHRSPISATAELLLSILRSNACMFAYN